MTSTTKVSMKLLVDTKGERVLFAEASKEVIDFLFSLLCLPVGTVVRLLTKKGMVGCLGNLYESVENFNDTYFQPNQDKDVLLKPRTSFSSTAISGFLPLSNDNANDNSKILKLYTCQNCRVYAVTDDYGTRCTNCSFGKMSSEVQYIRKKDGKETSSTSSDAGFVKEVVTYMVMDDLVVQPMSTISIFTLLNKFNVKDVGVLQEKVVTLGMTEGIKLLKASLQSEMVLTSVFLKNTGSEFHLL